jgi:hypothetical protein
VPYRAPCAGERPHSVGPVSCLLPSTAPFAADSSEQEQTDESDSAPLSQETEDAEEAAETDGPAAGEGTEVKVVPGKEYGGDEANYASTAKVIGEDKKVPEAAPSSTSPHPDLQNEYDDRAGCPGDDERVDR